MNKLKKITCVSETQLKITRSLIVVSTIAGAFVVPWNYGWALTSIFFYYLYITIGVGMMLHRYYTHRSFEFKNKILRYIFVTISIVCTRGSPLGWAHIHRTHHITADTDKDPHRSTNFSFFSFRTAEIEEFNPFIVRDLFNTENRIIHEYYLLFIIGWVALLWIIDPLAVYFLWIFPSFLTQIGQDIWNYIPHKEHGYINFEITDKSRNVSWLWLFIFGEAWHNNHHAQPGKFSFQCKWWEVDPIGRLIKLIKV